MRSRAAAGRRPLLKPPRRPRAGSTGTP
jgi:hypothetical protein